MKKLALIVLIASGFLASSQAFAFGEAFKVDSVGTKYCAGQAPIEVDPTTTAPYFFKIVSATQISVYTDLALTKKAFDLPVKLDLLTTNTSKKGAVVKVYAVNALLSLTTGVPIPGYFAINGIIKAYDDVLKLVKVEFIRKGLSDTCSASGGMIGKPVI